MYMFHSITKKETYIFFHLARDSESLPHFRNIEIMNSKQLSVYPKKFREKNITKWYITKRVRSLYKSMREPEALQLVANVFKGYHPKLCGRNMGKVK